MNTNKPILSIIILSYNTKRLTLDCLKSLEKVYDEVSFEVIVVDNASTDGSVSKIKSYFAKQQLLNTSHFLIENKKNLGFSKGNNLARKVAKGEYILFLNSDTIVHKNTLKKTVKYLERNKDVGSVTCKIVLPNGDLDKDVRRAFPIPWVALTHLVLRLDRLFPRSRLFAQYWYGYRSEDEEHEVDVIQGAYHLSRKKILDKVGWFDEDYFLDGEDIDLCWKIKKQGWKIVYYPRVSITHIKKASKKNHSKENRRKFATSGVDSMEIFYRKRLWDVYPKFVNLFIILGIRLVKLIRIQKIAVR